MENISITTFTRLFQPEIIDVDFLSALLIPGIKNSLNGYYG